MDRQVPASPHAAWGPERDGRLGCAVTLRCVTLCLAARGQEGSHLPLPAGLYPRQGCQIVYSLGMQLTDVGLPKPETCGATAVLAKKKKKVWNAI